MSENTERRIVKVAAAFLLQDGRGLLCRRASGSFAKKWELPGGKVEPGESAEQTCRREIQEELNLTLGDLSFLTEFSYDYPDFTLQMQVFEGPMPPEQELTLKVHDAAVWAGPDELPGLDIIEADRVLIPALVKALRRA